MATPPTTLHIVDMDGTLYRSPSPPKPDPAWWFHAHSLGEPGAPGFDDRWILATIARARHIEQDPTARMVILTGRADHGPMRKKIHSIVRLTGLKFDAIQLQPVLFPGSTAQFKGAAVKEWLEAMPTVKKVYLYDDEPENHVAVESAVVERGIQFKGFLAPGVGG